MPPGLLDMMALQQGEEPPGLLGGMGNWLGNNQNALMAAGAGLLGGGGWAGGAQGFMQGRGMDIAQRTKDMQQRAIMSAVMGAGGSPAHAIAAASDPAIAKLFFERRGWPELKPHNVGDVGTAFDPATGRMVPQFAAPSFKSVGQGDSLVQVTPSIQGLPRVPAAGTGAPPALQTQSPNVTPAPPSIGGGPQVQTIMQGGPKFDDVTKLRTEFQNQPGPKQYTETLGVYQSMMKSGQRDTPASDLDMIYGLAKLLDPGSVVREGEFATVRSSQAIPDQIRGYWQYLVEGKGKLDQNARQSIMEIARHRIESYREQAQGDIARYRDLAITNRFDPSQVVKDFPETPRYSVPAGGSPGAPGQQPPVKGATQAPDGNWYVPDPSRPGKFLKVIP